MRGICVCSLYIGTHLFDEKKIKREAYQSCFVIFFSTTKQEKWTCVSVTYYILPWQPLEVLQFNQLNMRIKRES